MNVKDCGVNELKKRAKKRPGNRTGFIIVSLLYFLLIPQKRRRLPIKIIMPE